MPDSHLSRLGLRTGAIAAALTLFSGCATTGSMAVQTPRTGTVPVTTQSSPAIAHIMIAGAPLVADPSVSAGHYLELAKEAGTPRREAYLLDAAEQFAARRSIDATESILDALNDANLPAALKQKKSLLQAHSAQLSGDVPVALHQLRAIIANPSTVPALLGLAWGYRAEAELASGDRYAALTSLAAQGRYTPAAPARRQLIAQALAGLSVTDLAGVRDSASDPVLAGWADLLIQRQLHGNDPAALDAALAQWRARHPDHPADSPLAGIVVKAGAVHQVALLLPLSSRYASLAQAVYRGFSARAEADTSANRPSVVLYDTGAEDSLAPMYYHVAANEGADFIVGPLGRQAVDAVLKSGELRVPTLLLGGDEPTAPLPGNVYEFSLSPEREARQVARRAFADGRRHAGILYPDSPWGQRMDRAFADQWQRLGGELAATRSYPDELRDFSGLVAGFLDAEVTTDAEATTATERRHREQITVRPDLDCVLLAAGPAQARLIKPQFDYYLAQDIQIYATSDVFTGVAARVTDLDLNGIIFGDMPWVLQSRNGKLAHNSAVHSPVDAKTGQNRSSRDGQLQRFYAMGVDSYDLIRRLAALRNNPTASFQGATARLQVDANGYVRRELAWARFVNGVPQPLAAEPVPVPLTQP